MQGRLALVRNKDLPEDAFWSPEELRENLEDAGNRNFRIVALFYKWLEKGNPDPDRYHLKRVAHLCRLMASRGYSLGVFWDFGPLAQLPRNPDQKQKFRAGLACADMVYMGGNANGNAS